MPEPDRKSKRGSSVYNGSPEENIVHYKFAARLVTKKTLPRNDIFSQDGVERFMQKSGKGTTTNYELWFLSDRILFKNLKESSKATNHGPVLYKQIKGAFSIVNFPNMLILGIEYPAQSKRKYESFVLQSVSNADRVKQLLLDIRKQPDGKIHKIEDAPRNSVSLTGQLPRLSMQETSTQVSAPIEPNPSVYIPKDEESTESIPNQIEEPTPPKSRSMCHIPNSPIIPVHSAPQHDYDYSKSARRERPHSRGNFIDSRNYETRRSLPDFGNYAYLGSENNYGRARHSWIAGDRSSMVLNAIYQEHKDDVLFLKSNEYSGAQVVEDGPIYMICKREPARWR